MVASHPMIEFRRLFRFFGATRAVNDISFEVNAGTVLGYIGPNGAGKTTSMRILATLDLPSAGEAFVDGYSSIDDPDRVRKRLGFMPDYFGTYPDMNVEEYLDFFARSYGLLGKERVQATRRTMAFTGLDVLKEKPIRGLSKGMKQRLCLGRAMIHSPAVMLLDEPANGLDPRARIELRDMIRQLAADGKTVLVSSHILTELAEMCDRVAIIERGTLMAVGSVTEIQKRLQPHRVLRLSVDDPDHTKIRNWLSERTDIEAVENRGGDLFLSHHGGRAEEVALLRELIQAGFPIAEFANFSHSLEDVFMAVTRGQVQ